MRESDKSYLWCTEAWFRTKPGTTPRKRVTTNIVKSRLEAEVNDTKNVHLFFTAFQT